MIHLDEPHQQLTKVEEKRQQLEEPKHHDYKIEQKPNKLESLYQKLQQQNLLHQKEIEHQ